MAGSLSVAGEPRRLLAARATTAAAFQTPRLARGQSAARFRRLPIVFGGTVLLLLVAAAVWGWLAPPVDPLDQDFALRLAAPGDGHPLGMDHLGRDILARLLAGARITLLVGILSTAGACVIGVPVGALSAGNSRLAAVLARALDAIQAFPFLVFALVLVTALGASTTALVIALAVGYAPYVARVVEGRVRQETARDYVLAARAIGQRPPLIALRHILPNAAPTLLVQATEVFAGVILAEAALSFIGLGPAVSSPTWGRMLFDARSYMELAPHTALVPVIAICAVVLGANLFGDGVRDAFDPVVARGATKREKRNP